MNRVFHAFCFAFCLLAMTAGMFVAQFSVDSAIAQTKTIPKAGNPLVELNRTTGSGNAYTAKQNTDIRVVIARVIRVALGFVGVIMVILILYAGTLWFSARGNSDQVETAKNIIRNAIIGLLIISISFALVRFIFRTPFTSSEVPAGNKGFDQFLNNPTITGSGSQK